MGRDGTETSSFIITIFSTGSYQGILPLSVLARPIMLHELRSRCLIDIKLKYFKQVSANTKLGSWEQNYRQEKKS